jgi:hypothetical protein
MKKITLMVAVIFMLTGLFLSNAYCGGDVSIQVKDFKYNGNGQVVVHYALLNTYGFDYPNMTLGFKVSQGGKPIGCQRIKESIPKDANGSEIIELTIDADTGGRPFDFQYVTFTGGVDFNRVDAWFAGCD